MVLNISKYLFVSFFIFLLIFLFYITFHNLFENFDSKITNTTEDSLANAKINCGIMCTKVMGCKGFMVGNDKTCYLSKSFILGTPTNSVFKDDYNQQIERCNKYNTFNDTEITDFQKKQNATYICVPNQKDNIQTYKIYDTTEKQIYSLDDLPHINVDPYTFVDIEWNKQLDLQDYPKLLSNPTKNQKIPLLTEYTSEHLGDYLFPHKCVANITQYDCIRQCLNNSDCIGTEWNPAFIKKNSDQTFELHTGVCCPKKNITNVIARRNEYKHGSFYLKELVDLNDIPKKIIANYGNKL